jgi:hypothetical protein
LRDEFRKISRIGSLSGGTKWYLSEDCLLAAKRVMYSVEYKRFYLRDLEYIVVSPNQFWLLRPIIPGVLFVGLGVLLWQTVDFTTGAIFGSLGLVWAGVELALGPTAAARIRTTGSTVDLPIVKRTRRARKVLAKVDAAVRAARGDIVAETPASVPPPQPAAAPAPTEPASASATPPAGDLTYTNGS